MDIWRNYPAGPKSPFLSSQKDLGIEVQAFTSLAFLTGGMPDAARDALKPLGYFISWDIQIGGFEATYHAVSALLLNI